MVLKKLKPNEKVELIPPIVKLFGLLVLQFDVVKPCKTTKVRTVLQFTPNKKSIFTKLNYKL